MANSLTDYFKCPSRYAAIALKGAPASAKGYFRYGEDVVCFGRSSGQSLSLSATENLYDVSADVSYADGTLYLPFDTDEVVDDLRCERYTETASNGHLLGHPAVVAMYYRMRPMLSVQVRRHLQSMRLKGWDLLPFPRWPVDCTVDQLLEKLLLMTMKAQGVDRAPFIWFWPDGHGSAAAVTHDVETPLGRDFCKSLMDIDDSFGIKASFQVVPECRYEVTQGYIDSIWDRGFEVAVQDLNHDGRLYSSYEVFKERAARINAYGAKYRASGFRAAVLYRYQPWYGELDFAYDMSVPNVAHLDPQRGGCCTVMPYFVGKMLELPVTTIQDYSLFYILKDYSIDLWKKQIALITGKHGLSSFIIHPDYVTKRAEQAVYRELLAYLAKLKSEGNVWVALPGEIDRWWRQRSKMRIVEDGTNARIEGPYAERARIAYASEESGRLVYTLAPAAPHNWKVPADPLEQESLT